MFLIDDVNGGESYAITPDASGTTWLIIRKRADETGYSPLIDTGNTLEEAFAKLARILESPSNVSG